MKYEPSELIINEDGSIFHLHVKPDQLADRVILVGDPGRVDIISKHFDEKECDTQSREFHCATGWYKGKRITCLSHGIGCDNIDIVMNELDALANIDFELREDRPEHRTLTIVRIGTCGGLQPEAPIGTFVASAKSIGFDGLLNYYAGRDEVCDLDMEAAFTRHMNWSSQKGAPYVATASPDLAEQIAGDDMLLGITIACGGFYGPQGRQIRLKIQDPDQNAKIASFRYVSGGRELKVYNFEMESSALAGLASLLGHRAMTCCMVIANRFAKEMQTDYKGSIDSIVKLVLDRI